MVSGIRSVDLSNGADLERYLSDLSPMGMRLLDNMQSRVLTMRREDADDTPSEDSIAAALEKLDFVLDTASIDDDMAHLGGYLGLRFGKLPAANVSPAARTVDTKNPLIRAAISARTEIDHVLMEHVAKKKAALLSEQ